MYILELDFHVECTTEIFNDTWGEELAYQIVHILKTEFDNCVLNGFRIDIDDIHRHLTTSQFLTENGSLLKCIDRTIGINTTLKTETGICAQTMTAGTLTNPCRMEVGTLKHHILRGLVGTTTLSAKHAGNTHRILGIADSQVAIREFMLHTIECLERCAIRHRLHHNLMTLHHICIEAMQGLTIGHHDIIGDIHDIVDRTQTDCCQLILQPVR